MNLLAACAQNRATQGTGTLAGSNEAVGKSHGKPQVAAQSRARFNSKFIGAEHERQVCQLTHLTVHRVPQVRPAYAGHSWDETALAMFAPQNGQVMLPSHSSLPFLKQAVWRLTRQLLYLDKQANFPGR